MQGVPFSRIATEEKRAGRKGDAVFGRGHADRRGWLENIGGVIRIDVVIRVAVLGDIAV